MTPEKNKDFASMFQEALGYTDPRDSGKPEESIVGDIAGASTQGAPQSDGHGTPPIPESIKPGKNTPHVPMRVEVPIPRTTQIPAIPGIKPPPAYKPPIIPQPTKKEEDIVEEDDILIEEEVVEDFPEVVEEVKETEPPIFDALSPLVISEVLRISRQYQEQTREVKAVVHSLVGLKAELDIKEEKVIYGLFTLPFDDADSLKKLLKLKTSAGASRAFALVEMSEEELRHLNKVITMVVPNTPKLEFKNKVSFCQEIEFVIENIDEALFSNLKPVIELLPEI